MRPSRIFAWVESENASVSISMKMRPSDPTLAVKCRRLGVLEVRKKPPDPWLEMVFEDVAVGPVGSNDLAAGEAGHDFEKYRNVILGFRLSLSPLKADLLQGFAEPGEGTPIEVTRQII